MVSYFTNGNMFLYIGKWFLDYTILNPNASQISQTDWTDFVFFNSKVSNLQSLSKICSTNNSLLAFLRPGKLKKMYMVSPF